MKKLPLILTVLIVASGAGLNLPAFAQPTKTQGQRVVESRVVSLQGNQVMLHDGTTVTIPRIVADPTEIEQGDTVKLTYEVKNGRNVASSIRFIDRPSGGPRRW
jgi:uncharacterized membrane-anchored protein